MKHIVSILLLSAAPALFAQPVQTPSSDPVPQAGDNTPRSSSNAATSHDRHEHKHRSGHHQRRHHATAKSHNS
jgi:hypothetical protein